MVADNSSQFPFQTCLIPELPEEIQQQMRSIANYLFNPLGLVVAITQFLCNSLVIIIIARTKSLQRPSLIMLCSLAVTDVIHSPLSVYKYIEVLTHKHMCAKMQPFTSSISNLCTLATLGNLAIISRDRYVAVRRPMWYRTHVTKSRAIKTICLPWLISAIVASVVYLSFKWKGPVLLLAKISSLLFYAICVCVIIFCYLSIYFRENYSISRIPNTCCSGKGKANNQHCSLDPCDIVINLSSSASFTYGNVYKRNIRPSAFQAFFIDSFFN